MPKMPGMGLVSRLTSVMPATQKVEIRKIMDLGQSRQKVSETPISTKS
jgi:hypothetical protein